MLAAAVLAGGAIGVLASRAVTPTANQPATPSPQTPPDRQTPDRRAPDQPAPEHQSADRPVAVPDSVPLGFDVRYVDENGKFVTITPEDFPR